MKERIQWEKISLPKELLSEKVSAADGDVEAMLAVADYFAYWNPKGMPTIEEVRAADKLYKAAIRRGDTSAMLNYGGLYRDGIGRKKSRLLAHSWYLRAVLTCRLHPWKDRSGYRALGNSWRYDCDEDGCLIPSDNKLRLLAALFWYRRGAKQEEMNSLYELGDFYLKGLLVKQDAQKAYSLYCQALNAILDGPCPENDDNYDDVAFRLARCFHLGIGTKKNLEKAKEYIDLAVDKYRSEIEKGGVWDKRNLEAALAEQGRILQDLSETQETLRAGEENA